MLILNILSFINLIVDKSIDKNILLNQNNISEQKLFLTTNSINASKIGIVDFRYILKKSNAIKVLGNKFLIFEKKINEKVKIKQFKLKLKEKKILNDKNKFNDIVFQNQLKLLKEEVFQTQKKYKEERSLLNKSFQKIQKKIKDLLAQVIKEVSKKKNINVVFLKENVFLFNDTSIDFTNDVLKLFNEKTKSMSITITLNN
jgi:Skp family chaperone for outer membrane proteins